MTQTLIPFQAHAEDPANGYMTVQRMLFFLRDAFDLFKNSFLMGASTVAQGNTTVTVVHGLNKANHVALITPKNNPGGNWWISGKTATQFVINLAVAAPVGGIAFDWMVKEI